MAKILLEMKNITKTFPGVKALDNVNLQVEEGEIHALVGENGAGKSTLMNVLSGIYPYGTYEGDIVYDGEVCKFQTIKDSEKKGIVIIHQELALVPQMTIGENMFLGNERGKKAAINWNETYAEADKYLRMVGLSESSRVLIKDIGTGKQQLVEIAKALAKQAKLLILDEPTSSLNETDSKALLDLMLEFKKQGMTMIIITHKLNEVKEISDVVAILRKGEHIKTVKTAEVTEKEMTEMMVGRKVELNIERTEPVNVHPRLTVANLTLSDSSGVKKLDNVGFIAYSGEILGIAGIAGSGQKELLEAIAGLRKVEDGSIIYTPENESPSDLVGKSPMEIKNAGVSLAFVPEDRLGMGLVGSMGMTENMLLRFWNKKRGVVIDKSDSKKLAEDVFKELEVVTPSIDYPVRKLSGGNVQKVLVGREIASSPSVLMSAYAVRGLDINTSYTIYDLMSKQKQKGAAVIFVGEDLDVLLALCDRIMVMCGGKVTGIVDARKATKEEVGLLMTKNESEAA